VTQSEPGHEDITKKSTTLVVLLQDGHYVFAVGSAKGRHSIEVLLDLWVKKERRGHT